MTDSFWTEKIKTAEEHQADAFAILSGSVLTTASADADYIKKVAAKVQTVVDIFPSSTKVAEKGKDKDEDDDDGDWTPPWKKKDKDKDDDKKESKKDDDDGGGDDEKKEKKEAAEAMDGEEKSCPECGEKASACKCVGSEKEAAEAAELAKIAGVLDTLRSTPDGLEMLKMAKAIGYDAADAHANITGGALKKAEALSDLTAVVSEGVSKTANDAKLVTELAEAAGKGIRARDVLVPLGMGGAGAAAGWYGSDDEHKRRNALLMGLAGTGAGGIGAIAGRSGVGGKIMEAGFARGFSKDVKPEAIQKMLSKDGALSRLVGAGKYDARFAADLEEVLAHPALVRGSEPYSHLSAIDEAIKNAVKTKGHADFGDFAGIHSKLSGHFKDFGHTFS